MTRQHPVHDTIAALTRQQRQRIHITPEVSYKVTAPCLLAQLADSVGQGMETGGGRGIPDSRPTVAVDALDLWLEILHNTHSWAQALNVDRRPYLTPAPSGQVPPVGRLLRHVASLADSTGQDDMADAIHRSADRWRRQIEAMLHGQVEQRGVRGAECPACGATHVTEDRDDGRHRVPAIVLVARDINGEPLRWLACLACGWSDSVHGHPAQTAA